ncbi:MAG: hypothetical protein ACR2KP_15510 [Egibacteraceae bacterium]
MTGSGGAPGGLPSGTRIVVLRGRATAEETAAVVVALDAARRAEKRTPRPARQAWLRAARTEAVGARPLASPADL